MPVKNGFPVKNVPVVIDDKWIVEFHAKCYQRGCDAFWCSIPFSSNPNRVDTTAYVQWQAGWADTFKEFALTKKIAAKDSGVDDAETYTPGSLSDC